MSQLRTRSEISVFKTLVRSYETCDRQGVFNLLAFLPHLYPEGLAWLDQRLADVEHGRAYCTVALMSERLAGILIDTPKGKRTSKISTLYVHKRAAGQGLGSSLLHANANRWHSRGVDTVYVTVAGCRRAAIDPFLFSSGFVEVANLIDRYGPGRNELVYSLKLN